MKLDILSDMDEIKVCVAYKGEDGTEVNHFPSSLSYLGKCSPVYKSFAGWSSKDIDISRAIVPRKMKNFLEFSKNQFFVHWEVYEDAPKQCFF